MLREDHWTGAVVIIAAVDLEADFPIWEPGELNIGCSHSLETRQVNGSLPAFVSKVTFDFKVFPEALDHLEVDVIQRRSARNEVLCSFLISYAHLDQFVAAQVIGKPPLATLALPANPVSKQLARVGVALSFDVLVVHEVSAMAGSYGRIG